MKIRLVYPRFMKFLEANKKINDLLQAHQVGNYTMPPSLALPIIASITPVDIEIALTDDNIGDPINYDEDVDLVAISCFTPQAQRAYEIADEFRKNNKRVVLGGIHPTALPEEAIGHADAVCIGEAESTWPFVINDLRNGFLKKFYYSDNNFDLSKLSIPNRDIFNRDVYDWHAHLIQTTRGCPMKCDGCPIPQKEGEVIRYRPIDDVITDIRSMPYNEFYIIDDSLLLPGKKQENYFMELMSHTKDMNVNIFLPTSMMMARNMSPDKKNAYFKKLKEGGVSTIYTVFGFEQISQALFNKEKCNPYTWQQAIELVNIIKSNNIHFFGSFGIGFDYQDESVIDKILRFCDDADIDLAEFYINTPYPGTPFGIQAEKEDRLLHRNYMYWNQSSVVFKPKHFTESKLEDSYYELWKEFYHNKLPEATIRSFDIDYRKQPVLR